MFLWVLQPKSVVALTSQTDPTFAPVTWTEYTLRVSGVETDAGLTFVELVDPVYTGTGDGLLLRVVDTGVKLDEPVVFPMDLTNITDAASDLTFFSGQRAEVVFENGSGEAYRWSPNLSTRSLSKRAQRFLTSSLANPSISNLATTRPGLG